MMTGQTWEKTVVLWEEYTRHLKAEPRNINDCFQRRKKSAQSNSPIGYVLCQVGPREYVTTAAVQIVFLQMIDSIQLLDHIPKWLPQISQDQRETSTRRNAEVEQCRAQNKVYRRRALNPVKRRRDAPCQVFE